ncbi:c-type cytochrome [Roseibium sediminis]|uniref:c-type cytochrome n=1 Tax=Roseibium sediminis TaxID=1775174 RepID=UPI00123D3750|nr:cytochrome c [Roseibium sediminis]
MSVRTTKLLVVFLVGVLLALGGIAALRALVSRSNDGPNTGSLSSGSSASSQALAEGRALYLDHCAVCHGKNLEGQVDWQTPGSDGAFPAPPHDETGHTWHHPDELLFKITKFGSKTALGLDDPQLSMPAFKDVLTDDEIASILSFIKSTWSEEIRAQQRARTH